jgi:hypothetical protein
LDGQHETTIYTQIHPNIINIRRNASQNGNRISQILTSKANMHSHCKVSFQKYLISSFSRGEVDGDQQSTPFREWFGKLGEVRSLVQCPLLLITATASKASRLKMQKIFCMKNCLKNLKAQIEPILNYFCTNSNLAKILQRYLHL